MSSTDAEYWDSQAATFDSQPEHGLLTLALQAAWLDTLVPLLPPAPAEVLDLGSGTGSLSVLLAGAGFAVRGLDLSAEMVTLARGKAARAAVPVEFRVGDAATPPYPLGCCDVVLARHLLWALPRPDLALSRWVSLLRPGGRLVLVEGRWSTGAGLTADGCRALVLEHRREADLQQLSSHQTLWGGAVDDERYVLVSCR